MTYVILYGAIMKSIIILVYFCSAGASFCSWFGIWCATTTALQPQAKETNNNTKIIKEKFDLNKLKKAQSFKCESESPYHTWYQAYRNEHPLLSKKIGYIHFDDKGRLKSTEFILTVEAFDNGSEIHCYNKKKEKTKTIWKLQVTGIPTEKKKYDILKYNEKHNVSSEYMKSCYKIFNRNNNETFLGVINTTSNQIKLYDMEDIKEVPPKFDKKHNGSILCCLNYKVQTNKTNGCITRHVKEKKILVYDVTDQKDSLEDTEKRKEEITSVSTTEDAKGTDTDTRNEDAKGTDADTRNEDANLDSEHTKPGNHDADSSNQYADSGKTLTIYIVSAVAGVLILLVIVIIIKRCRKNPKSKVVEEPTVLYAELDLFRQHESRSLPKDGPEEESTYAEIVGEIRPQPQ